MKATNVDVLIVGAGPTGLMLAGWLNRRGVRFRIVDQNAGTGKTSRALVVQARTLEYYEQLGMVSKALKAGCALAGITMWVRGDLVGRMTFGTLAADLSRYPYLFALPQDANERILLEHLNEYGSGVEWCTRFQRFEPTDDHVIASLELPSGKVEEVRTCYLCGCDGAHSTVREGLGVGFAGGTSPQRLFVADVYLSGERSEGEVNGFFGEESFYGIFPLPGKGHARLVGLLPECLPPDSEVTFEALRPDIESRCKVTVHRVQWFSTYRVHHRVAEHFSKGRVFLVGDAAHIHSPAGGQGMNTGIGDAVNLAWKLAEVLSQDRHPSILETYEAERIPFAKTLVRTTDRFFRGATNPTRMAKIFRLRVMPSVASVATRLPVVRRHIFRLLSQILINYRDSRLSLGRTGRLWAGDRLPWIPREDGKTNYDPLVTLDWQIHVYGNVSSEVQTCADECGLPVHQLPHNDAARRFGIQRNAVYLIRPDGHVGCAFGPDNVSLLRQYWKKLSEVQTMVKAP